MKAGMAAIASTSRANTAITRARLRAGLADLGRRWALTRGLLSKGLFTQSGTGETGGASCRAGMGGARKTSGGSARLPPINGVRGSALQSEMPFLLLAVTAR